MIVAGITGCQRTRTTSASSRRTTRRRQGGLAHLDASLGRRSRRHTGAIAAHVPPPARRVDSGSYDPATNLIYWGTPRPTVDAFCRGHRRRRALQPTARWPIDPATGKIVVHYQHIPARRTTSTKRSSAF
jgi:hypothetical protein